MARRKSPNQDSTRRSDRQPPESCSSTDEPRRSRDRRTTSRIMATVKNRGSTAELAVRRRLWANGLRYRLNAKLPGKPDLVFPRQRIAIFIDGDLWHGNSWRVRGLPSLEAQFPNRTEWWVSKIRRNMERDDEVTDQLSREGWTVLRFWESGVLADPNEVARSIAAHVRRPHPVAYVDLDVLPIERRRLASVKLKRRRPTTSSTSGSSPLETTGRR